MAMEGALDWVWPLLAAPLIGSFLGVLIRRLPRREPVALARSVCPSCGTPLAARDLVPLLSYAVLRGRCRTCRAPIGAFHWHVELAALVLAAIAAVAASPAWPACVFGWALLALAWIDAETMTLPDVITVPLVPAGLAVTAWLAPADLGEHAWAAAIGFATLRLVAITYRRLRGRDGMGAGDAKLLAAIGAWVGLADLPMVLFGAALAGLAWALWLRWRGAELTGVTALPFGPFLALSGWITFLAAR